MWLWMQESWLQDLEEKHEFQRAYSILTGAFSNAEMAKRMIKMDNPDFQMSDEDLEKVSQEIVQKRKEAEQAKPKRRRRRVLSQGSS